MLEKEAFALLTKRVWHMLEENTPIRESVLAALSDAEPQQFREHVARAVLTEMTQVIGRTVVPAPTESGDDFLDAVALAFAILAESDRPPKYDGYTAHGFAEMLIEQFCRGYAALGEASPTDETLEDCRVILDIPTRSENAQELRARLRDMPICAFGEYTLLS